MNDYQGLNLPQLLELMHELVFPEPISRIPEGPGWWILFGWLVAVIVIVTRSLSARYRRNRYRREADSRLRKLSPEGLGEQLIAEINKLLKLAAIAAYGREMVARLYGEKWVTFLNRQCPDQSFTPEQAGLLAAGAYQPVELDADTANALLQASILWVRHHQENTDV